MSRLIWIFAVCKNLLLSPFAVKELKSEKEYVSWSLALSLI